MTKFYICERCKNVVIDRNGEHNEPSICCGEAMKELIPGTVEASREKHIPVASLNGRTVSVVVGSVEHPMSAEHSIEWIYLETNKGGYKVDLSPSEPPKAEFKLACREKPTAVYAYCNLHGLWMAEM